MSVKKSFISVFTISYSIFENRKQSDFLVIKSGKKKRNIFLKLTALAFTQKHKTFWSRYLFFKKIGKEGYLWKLSAQRSFSSSVCNKEGLNHKSSAYTTFVLHELLDVGGANSVVTGEGNNRSTEEVRASWCCV